MKLEMGKFKKIASDKNTTTMRHEDGHTLKIAHSALSPKLRSQLHAMPIALAEGTTEGPVSSEEPKDIMAQAEQTSSPANAPQPQMPTGAPAAPTVNINVGGNSPPPTPPPAAVPIPGVMQPTSTAPISIPSLPTPPQGLPPEANTAPPPPMPSPPPAQQVQGMAPSQVSAGQPSGGAQAPSDPYGAGYTQNAFESGIYNQLEGAKNEANAAGVQAGQEAGLYQKQAAAQQEMQKVYEGHLADAYKERNHFIQDLHDENIDPQHYFNSMGTGQKISTAIGLILGGLGGGLAHQENPVMKFMNQQIENDINSQKANIDKGKSLLSANMEHFKNIHDATDMTRVMQNDIVATQLKQAAAKNANPLIQARAQQHIGQIEAQNAGTLGQMAARRTLLSGSGSQPGGMESPERAAIKIKMLASSPEEYDKAINTLKEAQDMAAFRDMAISSQLQLQKINTVANRVAHAGKTPPEVAAIIGPLKAVLGKELAGKYTEQDSAEMEKILSSPFTGAKTDATKLQQLIKLIDAKNHFPQLAYYQINPMNFSRYDAQGRDRMAAKSTPPVIGKK